MAQAQIVTVNVSQIVASMPDLLQEMGAFVTQGGTNTDAGTVTILTETDDLVAIIGSGDAATELQAMTDTFFAQGNSQSVYVLELGSGAVNAGVASLGTYITTNVGNPPSSATPQFYAFLVPAEWDGNANFIALTEEYEAPTAWQYFYVTTVLANYALYANIKSIFWMVPMPGIADTEFSLAATFYDVLSQRPGTANMVGPLEWTYQYDVTAYDTLSPGQVVAIEDANGNYVGTGAEGGIDLELIVGGVYGDGHPWNYWYGVDWAQINGARALAAGVINGSNTPTNPLYYNQGGINSLRKTLQATMNNGISFGLFLAPAPVTAIPFTTYVEENPDAYEEGDYGGFACTFVPARGFAAITINFTASDIPLGT
jgi:hypothetical protein